MTDTVLELHQRAYLFCFCYYTLSLHSGPHYANVFCSVLATGVLAIARDTVAKFHDAILSANQRP
jgi:hypothetical protein